MPYESMAKNLNLLKKGDSKGKAIVNVIADVENYPYYKSVGYGGLPNSEGIVELDAAFMNGQTLSVGAVAGVTNIKNPIKVAQKLSLERFNNFLVANGAEKYARANKFVMQNMLSDRARKTYEKKKEVLKKNPHLSPYDGHDTVGVVSLDSKGNIFAATSTSGLFYKKPGRVGDSPFPGAGYYCNKNIGGATATGLGEDIMKGCLSFQTVQFMAKGLSPTKAAQKAIDDFDKDYFTKNKKHCGPISIVALNKNGEYGIGTNVEFSFVAVNHKKQCHVYLAKIVNKKIIISLASRA
jgi:isoaspartyl peptidase/L-asparaginase-like protein (Ntn-hydrolase superfamily)